MRVKRGIHRHRRVKALHRLTKGYRGMRRSTVKKAKEAVIKAGQNAYRDRKRKKRDFRSLWTVRISAALRAKGLNYSRFIPALKKANITLDRKSLSELAIHHPAVFEKVLKEAGM
ncbi:50S ribosomal protein L20 [Candidatus Peribacteria bacterium RIFCSPLOWO2_01_FULL_51_18]|nr:MAG: 50S ribosomal protein L20 [Candidatus Peribacteria bacterium RIFCSPHIGHO2_02_FULL_51_15]OGJ66408.1 MAG: 50S ribosomal protein L20 [Candidatus Peribacteria bacterium RIFCSPLOWO2_01_FULL_51_18]OGJ69466.1 MAG: 50S ribosomal protein L20 [Candidatus Peribacteria bacterium RIFCSPLOWO2_02_FULL_51_10]